MNVILAEAIDLDFETKLLTVTITETVNGFFRDRIVSRKAQFTYVGQGVWLDAANLIVSDLELAMKLQEILVGLEANKRLDRYIATP